MSNIERSEALGFADKSRYADIRSGRRGISSAQLDHMWASKLLPEAFFDTLTQWSRPEGQPASGAVVPFVVSVPIPEEQPRAVPRTGHRRRVGELFRVAQSCRDVVAVVQAAMPPREVFVMAETVGRIRADFLAQITPVIAAYESAGLL